jgi:hypothetical protein
MPTPTPSKRPVVQSNREQLASWLRSVTAAEVMRCLNALEVPTASAPGRRWPAADRGQDVDLN